MPAAGPVQAPQIVYVPPGSMQLPSGYSGAPAAPSTPAATAANGAVPAQPGAAPPAITPAPTPGAATGPTATVATTGATAARVGASLLGRAMALLPIAAGLTQTIVGLLITKGTIPITAAPLIGGLPKFVVGGLVAATATPTLLGGVARLLGKA